MTFKEANNVLRDVLEMNPNDLDLYEILEANEAFGTKMVESKCDTCSRWSVCNAPFVILHSVNECRFYEEKK